MWTEFLPLMKWIIVGLLGGWALWTAKEKGKFEEKAKHIDRENKKILEQKQYQLSALRRAEQTAKEAKSFSDALEKKLKDIDPHTLDQLGLDLMSSQPLPFSDIHTSPNQSEVPSEEEDDLK